MKRRQTFVVVWADWKGKRAEIYGTFRSIRAAESWALVHFGTPHGTYHVQAVHATDRFGGGQEPSHSEDADS